jgi:hypothetical protein
MNKLLWVGDIKNAYDSQGPITLREKPNFGFPWKEIKLLEHESCFSLPQNGNWMSLSPNQISVITSFIKTKRLELGPNVHAVDKEGFYLGFHTKNIENFFQQVNEPPPNVDFNENFWCYNFDMSEWQRKYFYNDEGYITDKSHSVGSTFIAPSMLLERWDENEQQWKLKGEELAHTKENFIYESFRASLISTISCLYREKCDGSNIEISDYLDHIINTFKITTNEWLKNNLNNDNTLNIIIDDIFSKQNEFKNNVIEKNDAMEMISDFDNFISYTKNKHPKGGCFENSSDLGYPKICHCTKKNKTGE